MLLSNSYPISYLVVCLLISPATARRPVGYIKCQAIKIGPNGSSRKCSVVVQGQEPKEKSEVAIPVSHHFGMPELGVETLTSGYSPTRVMSEEFLTPQRTPVALEMKNMMSLD